MNILNPVRPTEYFLYCSSPDLSSCDTAMRNIMSAAMDNEDNPSKHVKLPKGFKFDPRIHILHISHRSVVLSTHPYTDNNKKITDHIYKHKFLFWIDRVPPK